MRQVLRWGLSWFRYQKLLTNYDVSLDYDVTTNPILAVQKERVMKLDTSYKMKPNFTQQKIRLYQKINGLIGGSQFAFRRIFRRQQKELLK